MLALILAWVFGASGFVDGCNTIVYYKESVDPVEGVQSIKDDAMRAEAVAAAERYVKAMNDAKNRAFPLGVAALLLGAVTIAFAARAMAGREGARTGLIQMVTAQTALVFATHFLTPEVQHARVHLETVVGTANIRETGGQDPVVAERYVRFLARFLPWRATIYLSVRGLASGLVILALTRARSREFFAAAEARWSGLER